MTATSSDQPPDPWPRKVQALGRTLLVHQPHIDSWKDNQLVPRSAVAVEVAGRSHKPDAAITHRGYGYRFNTAGGIDGGWVDRGQQASSLGGDRLKAGFGLCDRIGGDGFGVRFGGGGSAERG